MSNGTCSLTCQVCSHPRHGSWQHFSYKAFKCCSPNLCVWTVGIHRCRFDAIVPHCHGGRGRPFTQSDSSCIWPFKWYNYVFNLAEKSSSCSNAGDKKEADFVDFVTMYQSDNYWNGQIKTIAEIQTFSCWQQQQQEIHNSLFFLVNKKKRGFFGVQTFSIC